MIDPNASSDRLASISDDTWFVLVAYFCAFFPWVVLSNTDYITEKWRTVRRTREHARYHMVFSIVPMMYVGVYAEAQRRAGDSKELGAALAALFLNLIHFVRTVWGLAQLNAFMAWCKEAMECLRAMKGEDEEGGSTSNDNESGGFSNDEDDETSLEEKLMVNNTVVDNELGGTDVGVTLSWRKAWVGVKRWEFKPSTWLETEYPGLCTARWTATFLCGMANDWCSERYQYGPWAREAITSFFSDDMFLALRFLRNVTCSVEESGKSTIVSIEENICAKSRGAAYGSDQLYYLVDGFELYNFENESLRSSYPARNEILGSTNNRDVAVAGLADTVELAKHLGVERLSAMRRYFDRYRPPTNRIWRKAWYLLLELVDCAPPDKSPLSLLFGYLEEMPFPYQLQMVALWDDCTNWRVLQASAHADIYSALFNTHPERQNLDEIEQRTANVFDVWRRESSSGLSPVTSMLGVSMESIRTFLGEWVMSVPDAVDWEPLISGEEFDFSVSSHLIQSFPKVPDERMVWECQRALQSKLSKTSTAHRNFTSNAELMMLFILSMPSLIVEEKEEKREEVNGNEESVVSDTGSSVSRLGSAHSTVDVSVGEECVVSDTGSSVSRLESAHSTVDVSVGVWRAWSAAEPQDVKVIIRIDAESRRASLRLQCGAPDTRFKWEDWVNTAMGMMKGFDEAIAKHGGNKGETKRWLRKVDLREPVVELCPFYWDRDDSVVETGTVGIWMGWRVFDGRICKFEMDQWLRACNIDLKDIDDRSGEEEVWRAEKVIWQVVKSGELEVDGET